MAVNFFIPKQINVGYQERSNTYTGKLAYIIYYDEKGKLRKETSWNSWRKQDLGNDIFDNDPTSGFVLNKKAGDYSTGWNHRQAYVRVHDPRGFEFEISIQNLLYILENATSTKGKGLEGDFIYGWDGTELVLIPCEAPDYKELEELNALRHAGKKIGTKDMKLGATYLTKKNEEYIYLGRFTEYDWRGEPSAKPKFWFCEQGEGKNYFYTMSSVSNKFIETISEDCVEDYASIMDELSFNRDYSPIASYVYEPYTAEELKANLEPGEFYRQNSTRVWVQGVADSVAVYYRERDGVGSYTWEIRNPLYDPMPYHSNQPYSKKYEAETVEAVIELLKPNKRYKYLANGNLYGKD